MTIAHLSSALVPYGSTTEGRSTMATTGSTYTYGSPQKGKIVATHPEKRSCLFDGCSTRLSIYNPALYCWLHDSVAPKRGLSPKRP
jgi:hypothetical protein